ncbi:hypothetical protein AYO43_04520 [Nitrospira sp. SCGC AG-212-E16]|nr:hypothetical protein AYO43_04520 [Nitrospira sp. SCGC AG-212-E16]
MRHHIMYRGFTRLIDRKEIKGQEARTFAVELHEAQRQLASRLYIGLQKLHVNRPSLMVLNSGVGRPAVSYG